MEIERCILIRYGELFLKGANKPYFEGLLKRNIKAALKGIKHVFSVSQARFYISGYSDGYEVAERLKKVFGIHSFSPAYKISGDTQAVGDFLCDKFDKTGKFRVTVNRADKRIKQNSVEIARYLGARLLESVKGLTVDLTNFDHEINVDIRENGAVYVFFEKILGAGGLPSGCSGKGLLLLSGGIDSPVAGYMTAKRGMTVHALHFHSFPHTSPQAREKVRELAKILKSYTSEMTIRFVSVTEIQRAIYELCPNEYLITILRRVMMRIADRLAGELGYDAVITGESLGQVASQTVESLLVSDSVTDKLVLRPLIALDKNEIIDIAKRIGTFETSILPFEDCCTVFMPERPAIHPKLRQVEEAEKALDLDNLINRALAETETEKL